VLLSFFNIICSFSTDIFYEKTIVNNLFEFDLDKKVTSLKINKNKENNDFQGQNPVIYPIKQKTRSTQKTESKLDNVDNLNSNNKINNDIIYIGRGATASSRQRYRVKSSFSSSLGKFENQRKSKNLLKNNNQNNRAILNEQNTLDRGTEKRAIIDKIKLSKLKVYFCFLCIRKTKNMNNILLDEGMNIVNEKLDILNLFRNMYKYDMIKEKVSKIETKGMSDECKQSLESLYVSSNFKFV